MGHSYLCLQGRPLAEDVSTDLLARNTPGMSGAELSKCGRH